MARYTLGSIAIRIWTADPTDPKSNGGAIIVNRDLSNQVLLGFDAGISVARTITQDPSGSILDPLGSITIDGTRDVWAVSAKAGATPLVDVIPNASYWAPSPAQVAAQIAASGVFSLTNQTLIFSSGTAGIAAGTTGRLNNPNPITLTQPSYEILISSQWFSAPTAGDQVGLQLQWLDANNNVLITDEWFIHAADVASANALAIHGVGPAKGQFLNVFARNAETAGQWNVGVLMYGNSRIYTTDEWIWTNANVVTLPAAIPPIMKQTDNWTYELGRRLGTSVANGATDSSLLGLWGGQLFYSFHSHSAALSLIFANRPANLLSNNAASAFFNQSVTNSSGTLWCPRGVLVVSVTNSSGSSQTYDFQAYAAGATE